MSKVSKQGPTVAELWDHAEHERTLAEQADTEEERAAHMERARELDRRWFATMAEPGARH